MARATGYCECGCGERTNIARQTTPSLGHVKGVPYRYVRGHHNRKSPVEYLGEDRGYETPCWIWQRGGKRYGLVWVDGRSLLAHRVYHERHKGAIPDGWQVDHLCFQTMCVNPDHLEAVPPVINVRRQRSGKLTAALADEIRRHACRGNHRALAARYGVTLSTIGDIVHGRTWREVTHG